MGVVAGCWSDRGRDPTVSEARIVRAGASRGDALYCGHGRRPKEALAMRTCLIVLGTLLAASPAVAGDAPTFYKDVLPILQANCQRCHRPGEVAPMSLLTFEETRPWARAIKTAVATRQMPPWFADPNVGHFANER